MPEPKVTTAEVTEAGYFGVITDDTPNEAYTVAGVTGGAAASPAAAPAATVDLSSMTKAGLVDYAAEQGVEVDSSMTKAEMIAAIEAG